LTAGEPAGIGPDLCLAVAERPRRFPIVFLADQELLAARARDLHLHVTLQSYRRGEPVAVAASQLTVLHQPLAVAARPGRLDASNARQVLRLIDRAVDGALAAEFAAIVTAPVQKSVINDAGIPFVGHTEYIAARTHAPLPVMMLTAGTLRVALATTHLPLRAVSAALGADRLLQIMTILDHDLRRDFGIARPRIAVCGLNPHAGEGGYLGDEEERIIAPAIARAQAAGLAAHGPLPADTVFVPRHLVAYDVVLAMFHDQGLPVLKHAGFGDAVNVTLGLPIVRTSVDHGTALDLAGRGGADPSSLLRALELAAELACHRLGLAASVRAATS